MGLLMTQHIAIDLGAESGRVIIGTVTRNGVSLEVVHRFPTPYLNTANGLRWDLPQLHASIGEGLTLAATKAPNAASIGVDTWGVDYGLVDADGTVLDLPFCYRDERTTQGMAIVDSVISRDDLFRRTGVQSMPFNTIYQLAAHQQRDPELLARASALLFMPDLLHRWLGGRPANEWSIAGTSGLLRPGTREWDWDLIGRLHLPRGLFQPVVPAGTPLGHLRPELVARFGFTTEPAIVTPAAHDTASAVAASPGEAGTTAYLSSGTWSLFGTVTDTPVIAAAGEAAKLGNEISADGRIRVNRNIMGLWLVQECRRAMAAAGNEVSYADLAALATAAGPSPVPLDVDDARFFAPSLTSDPMPARIAAWLHERDLPQPASDGALIRLILEGLAAAYARTLTDVERETGRHLSAVHILGGGSQHALLAQLTTNACQRPVFTGPVEATALGNVLMQARGLGLVVDDTHLRLLVAASVQIGVYQPG